MQAAYDRICLECVATQLAHLLPWCCATGGNPTKYGAAVQPARSTGLRLLHELLVESEKMQLTTLQVSGTPQPTHAHMHTHMHTHTHTYTRARAHAVTHTDTPHR